MFNLTLTRKPSLWGRQLYFHPNDVQLRFSPSLPVLGTFFSSKTPYLLLTANKDIFGLQHPSSNFPAFSTDLDVSPKRMLGCQSVVHQKRIEFFSYVEVSASFNSLIFLETFLAPTFLKQISWLCFPRIEISCSPLVIAKVRQLSVWYWAQLQAVVNLFSLFL